MNTPLLDPYRYCERGCHHDLVQGVLVTDLLGAEGPYPPLELVWQRRTTGWVRLNPAEADVAS